MTLDHKAYVFDWVSFEKELLPILREAVGTNSDASLREFLSRNISECCNPYDGEPLTPPWESNLEIGDVQELADFALTKFYDPDVDQGVGHNWIELDSQLPGEARRALLGFPVPGFDPGRQGAYFQSPSDVATSATALSTCPHPELVSYRELLETSRSQGFGAYVTF